VVSAATFLSLADSAEYLGVCERTVRRRIADGSLPAHRVRNSRLIRIDMRDLDALLTPIPTAGGGGYGDAA
jgi:excisionase family DNA binding protein